MAVYVHVDLGQVAKAIQEAASTVSHYITSAGSAIAQHIDMLRYTLFELTASLNFIGLMIIIAAVIIAVVIIATGFLKTKAFYDIAEVLVQAILREKVRREVEIEVEKRGEEEKQRFEERERERKLEEEFTRALVGH